MMVCRKQEANTDFGERLFSRPAGSFHVEPKCFQRVGCSCLRRRGTIAMLRDGNAARRDNQADRRRDIQCMVSVSAGPANVDRVVRCCDRYEALA